MAQFECITLPKFPVFASTATWGLTGVRCAGHVACVGTAHPQPEHITGGGQILSNPPREFQC